MNECIYATASVCLSEGNLREWVPEILCGLWALHWIEDDWILYEHAVFFEVNFTNLKTHEASTSQGTETFWYSQHKIEQAVRSVESLDFSVCHWEENSDGMQLKMACWWSLQSTSSPTKLSHWSLVWWELKFGRFGFGKELYVIYYWKNDTPQDYFMFWNGISSVVMYSKGF